MNVAQATLRFRKVAGTKNATEARIVLRPTGIPTGDDGAGGCAGEERKMKRGIVKALLEERVVRRVLSSRQQRD